MQEWSAGDLYAEFEQRLDSLLAELSPGWQPPELPEAYRFNDRFEAYSRRNAKRAQVQDRLTNRPHAAVALAERVLDAIVCDEDVSFNRDLIQPMLDSIGRRRVQLHLISVIESGPAAKKVCAVRAWYWSQVTLTYNSMDALHERRATQTSRAADDDVVDLRGRYRTACLTAFVACDHGPTRDWLARGCILREDFYPPNLGDLVAQARILAEADPVRYKDLLSKTEDGTTMAAIRYDGTE